MEHFYVFGDEMVWVYCYLRKPSHLYALKIDSTLSR